MRNAITKVTSFALLAGALALPALPASAEVASGAVATTAAVADNPYAVFDVKVKAPKKVKVGGKLNYRVTLTNKGPHSADAWFVGGQLPKGVDLKKVHYATNVPDSVCFLEEERSIFCLLPKVMEKGDTAYLTFETKLTKKAKGTQKAILGVVNYDVDQGMEDLSKEELDRLGVKSHVYAKVVKTKIVR